MTPDDALNTRLRWHLEHSANPVAGQANMAAELIDFGRPAPDAREAVARAFARLTSDTAEGQGADPGPSPSRTRETPGQDPRTDHQQGAPAMSGSFQPYPTPPNRQAPINGQVMLPPDERRELAELRAEVIELRARAGAARVWWPGQPLPPSLEYLRAQLEQDYDRDVAYRAREQQMTEDARRARTLTAWRQPTLAEFPGTLADSLKRERPVQRYLIGGMWTVAGNISVEAMFKTGKTALVASLAGSLADGTPFLGFAPVSKPAGTVAIWNCEMDPDDFDDYLRPHVSDASRIIPAHLRGRPVNLLNSQADREMTVAWLRFHSASAWIIDSWTRVCAWCRIDPIDNGAVAELTACLDEIKQQAGVTALAVTAHMPHAARNNRTFERGFGAQAFSAWLDAMWRYVRDDAGGRYLSAEGRKVSLAECQVFMDADGRLIAAAGDRDGAAELTLEYALLSSVRVHPGRPTTQVVKAASKRKEDAAAVLADLVRRGLLTTRPGPRGAVLWYPA